MFIADMQLALVACGGNLISIISSLICILMQSWLKKKNLSSDKWVQETFNL